MRGHVAGADCVLVGMNGSKRPYRKTDAGSAALITSSLVTKVVGRGLFGLTFQARNTPLMHLSDSRQAVDALHHVRQENLVLVVRFLVLALHSGDDSDRLGQSLVALSEPV